MAHIWNLIKDGAGERWIAVALAGDGCVVACYSDDLGLMSPAGVTQLEPARVLILPTGSPGAGPRWTLLAGRGAGVRVNGRPLALGVRALADKDEILAGGRRLFFSTEGTRAGGSVSRTGPTGVLPALQAKAGAGRPGGLLPGLPCLEPSIGEVPLLDL